MIKNQIRISFLITSILLPAIAGTLFGISIWANRPRGISIPLD